jgi:molybdate transport system substrate-binding protein
MESAPLTGISSMATKALLSDLAASYERKCGVRVTIESVGGVDAAKRVAAGEAFDLVVLAGDAIDKLIASGHLAADSKTAIVRSGVAVAVRGGAPRPDLSSEEAVKRAVLQAPTLGYSTGPSGVALARLFERWGIAQEIAPRIVQAPPGVPVGALVARGDVALGFQQLSELMNLQGIAVVGPLPPAIHIETTFAAAASTRSTQLDAVCMLLAYLASPETARIKQLHGMEPA